MLVTEQAEYKLSIAGEELEHKESCLASIAAGLAEGLSWKRGLADDANLDDVVTAAKKTILNAEIGIKQKLKQGRIDLSKASHVSTSQLCSRNSESTAAASAPNGGLVPLEMDRCLLGMWPRA